MIRSLLAAAFLLTVRATLPLAQATAAEPFVARHLALNVAIDFPAQRLSGSIDLTLENWTERSAGSVSLLLNRLMEVSAVRAADGTTLQFTQHVTRNVDMPMRQVTQVLVTLSQPVAPAQRTTVHVEYAGNLVGYTEVGWLYVRDRIDSAFTILREDALAFPAVGGRSFDSFRAMPPAAFTYDAAVRVPLGFVVATGGRGTRQAHNDGTVTWRYVTQVPAPFLNIAIAPYDTLAADGVRLFYFKADSAGAQHVMASAQRALAWLRGWFGPLRGDPNLTISEIPDGWGSQADLVAGIIQSAAAFQHGRLGELYHELAHLWNVPDRDTPSPRWNEGFASFMQGLIRENVDGWTGRREAEAASIEAIRRAAVNDSSFHTVAMIDYGRQRLTDRSYRVGALMFSALYELLGTAEFGAAIGRYYREFPNGGTTRDFVRVASANSRDDLTRFFDDWMFSTRWLAALEKYSSVSDLAAQYRRRR
jgi:aminopeptidase N